MGTAALRTADNAASLTHQLEAVLGHPIRIIDGQEEARLIATGVRSLLRQHPGTHLVLDIGGGSVELILLDQHGIISSVSLPLGIAVLHHRFHQHEPIRSDELTLMREHIIGKVRPWLAQLQNTPIKSLIGASGIFDVLADLDLHPDMLLCPIPKARIQDVTRQVTTMDLSSRKRLPGLPEERADLIVSAMNLIDVLIEEVHPEEIYTSAYAMKEGELLERMAGKGHSSSVDLSPDGRPI